MKDLINENRLEWEEYSWKISILSYSESGKLKKYTGKQILKVN